MFLSKVPCFLHHRKQTLQHQHHQTTYSATFPVSLRRTITSRPSLKTSPYRTLYSPYLQPTRILSDLLYSADQTLEERLRGIAWEPLSVLSPDLCPLMLYPFGALILFVGAEKLHSSFILRSISLCFFIAVHPCTKGFCRMLTKNALIKTPYWAHKSGEG